MRAGFLNEVRDAVSPRAAALIVAVLAIQLGFIASYIGAFHHPSPHRIPIAVVYPGAGDAIGRLNGIPGSPLLAHLVRDEALARKQIQQRKVYGALVITGTAADDKILVASAAGASVATALTQILGEAERSVDRKFHVEDVKPALLGDARGLAAFYLALGCVVGGYLVAIAVSASKGARPPTRHRALLRLGTLLVYALVSGVGGSLLAQSVFHALSGTQLWWFGALLVFAAGSFTMALQALLGLVGTGVTVLLFVVLGNPSAGGAYAAPLLPAFWRAVGPWLPPGIGTEAIRGITYFGGAGLGRAALQLGAYAVLGAFATVVARVMQEPRPVLMADLHKAKPAPATASRCSDAIQRSRWS